MSAQTAANRIRDTLSRWCFHARLTWDLLWLVRGLSKPVRDPNEWARRNRHAHPHDPDRDWHPGEMFGGGSVRPVNPNEKRRSNVQR